MAIFKIVDKEEGKKYKNETELANLVNYVIRGSVIYRTQNLLNIRNDMYLNQFLYVQSCAGKCLSTRARHFVLSFDTKGWEWQMKMDDVLYVVQFCLMPCFKNYQVICGLHENEDGSHIHIVINPINLQNGKLLRWNKYEYQNFLWGMAEDLYMLFGMALLNVSYVDMNGNLKKSFGETDLYQNRYSKALPLKGSDGKIVVAPFLPGMPICNL